MSDTISIIFKNRKIYLQVDQMLREVSVKQVVDYLEKNLTEKEKIELIKTLSKEIRLKGGEIK